MPDRKLKILHLEDLATDAELVHRAMIKGHVNFELQLTDTKEGFINLLDHFQPDLILSDHSLPSFDSIQAIKIVNEKGIKIPFILITATISEEFAVEVMKEGAWDYILKDRLQRLPTAIKNAMEKHRIATDRQQILDKIIANEALYKQAEKVAHFGTWTTNLLTGTTVMSDAGFRVLGYEPGDLQITNDWLIKIIHPDDIITIQEMLTNSMQGAETTAMIFRATGQDGRIRYINSQFQIERDSDGKAIKMIGFNQDVTLQKEAGIRIQESEKKYRHLFENNPLPMWVIDMQTLKFLDVNEAAVKHYGYSHNEFMKMTATQIRPKHSEEKFISLDRSNDFKGPNLGIWEHLKKDGTVMQVEIFAHRIEYQGRQVRLILANDVTEIRLSQEELHKSHDALAAAYKMQKDILDALPANIAMLNKAGNIMTVNNAWKKFGDENQLAGGKHNIGDNYIEISKKATGSEANDGARIALGIEEVIAQKRHGFTMEYPCHSPDAMRWFRVEVAPLESEEEKGAVVMHINITDRKLAEIEADSLNLQLKESVKQVSDYKTALNQSSIVVITDDQGLITYANDNFCRISKYSRAELIGQNHSIVNSGYHPHSFFRELWETIATGKIWKGEIKNKAKDGSIYWVDATMVPFMDEHGTPYQYMSIRSDITERKIAEEEISLLTLTLEKKVEERTAQLEQSMKELESFSYSVSHDLRAPLRVINGYAKLFIDEYSDKLDPDAIEYINAMNDNAKQMGQLIEDLLNLSRLGLEAIEKEDTDMRAVVECTLYESQTNTGLLPANLNVADMPRCKCSRNLMKQVWVNLLSNAIKYSGKKPDPTIQIGGYMTEAENIYYIKDNGAGFDMKYADKLFGVFQRLHHKEDFEGTGVGLALVHRIVTRHGGRVWAESKVDEGATFYFSLPRLN